MERHSTASVLVLRPLVSYARARGVDVDALLRQLGVLPAEIDHADVRVAGSAIEAAWAAVESALHDPALGIHVAEQTAEGDFEVLSYAVYFSSTVGEAMDRVARFHRLLADTDGIDVSLHRDAATVRRIVGGTHPQQQDAFFAVFCKTLRELTGGDLRPREVRFEHRRHAPREHSDFFRCPVHFGCAESVVVLSSSDLALPVRSAKPKLAALLDRFAEELVARLPPTSSYADHVRHAITRVIRRGPPTLDAVAREMRASPRTVQRRLADAGATLTGLVDEVRRRLALRYVESAKLSLTEIAFLLGFEDAGSLRRSFKRWTGMTPGQARAAAATRP